MKRMFALVLAAVAVSATQAQPSVSISVHQPGVYGRINIGGLPPPALVLPQPVLIAPPPVAVQRAPIYLYVPPGHARDWRRHCAHYGACNQPVYFVQEPPPRRGPPPRHYRNGRDDRRWDKDHGHGNRHDRRHDRDHGRDHDRDHGPRHRN